MLARILRSVLFPEPFRPTMPKNSPRLTSNETSRRARSTRYSGRASGWTARSFRESIRCVGIRNVFWTPRASIESGRSCRSIERLAASCSAISLRLLARTETPASERGGTAPRQANVVAQVLASRDQRGAGRMAGRPQEQIGSQSRGDDVRAARHDRCSGRTVVRDDEEKGDEGERKADQPDEQRVIGSTATGEGGDHHPADAEQQHARQEDEPQAQRP